MCYHLGFWGSLAPAPPHHTSPPPGLPSPITHSRSLRSTFWDSSSRSRRAVNLEASSSVLAVSSQGRRLRSWRPELTRGPPVATLQASQQPSGSSGLLFSRLSTKSSSCGDQGKGLPGSGPCSGHQHGYLRPCSRMSLLSDLRQVIQCLLALVLPFEVCFILLLWASPFTS